jgi:hypothetical protein
VGVVAGVFAEGPLAGRLRVQGTFSYHHRPAWLWAGTLVFAIPPHAVMHRTRHSLVLDVTLVTARARWLVNVWQRDMAASQP